MRAQAVEAVDRLLAGIEAELAQPRTRPQHLHRVQLGQRLPHGPAPAAARQTDGVRHRHSRTADHRRSRSARTDGRVAEVAQNVDLYPTFVQLAGGTPAQSDGHSLLPLLHPGGSGAPVRWRTIALIEHHGPTESGDPDSENGERGGNPSPYEAIRVFNKQYGNAVYVEYKRTGKREYYNLDRDPFERNNTYPQLSPRVQAQLHALLLGLERCHNTRACWAAADPQP